MKNYEPVDKSSYVFLFFLLLNGFEPKGIKYLEEKTTEKYGRKITKTYAMTYETVDIQKYEKELGDVVVPDIYSESLFSVYSTVPIVYEYTKKYTNKPLLINDFDIIGGKMMFSKDTVISSFPAKNFADVQNFGFMFFYDYVVNNHFELEEWQVSYTETEDGNEFKILYHSKASDGTRESVTPILSITNISKDDTYRFVLYIIKKSADKYDNWRGDNFNMQPYKYVGSGR